MVEFKIDGKRLKNWNKMEHKAKTDDQKSAVAIYKVAILKAVTDRRTAIDIAVKVYRDNLATAISAHNADIAGTFMTFKASVAASVAKAKADCTAKVPNQTVKDTFNKSIAGARKILQDSKKNDEGSSSLQALKQTRDNAIKLAETNFKTATEKARADLALALK